MKGVKLVRIAAFMFMIFESYERRYVENILNLF